MSRKRRIERVLLIQPPLTTQTNLSSETKGVHPPIGLASLAAVIEKEYDVKIIDCVVEGYHTEVDLGKNLVRYGLSYEEIKSRVEDIRPDIVGISNLFSSGYKEAIEVAALIKQVDNDMITVIGGPHPSALPEQTISNEDLDFVVIGEGEYSFRELLRSIEQNDFTGLDGIALKSEGKIEILPKTKFIQNLDELPFPARHLLPMDKYFEIGEAFIVTRRKPFTPLNTSRGCTARCSFCPVHAAWGNQWRPRSAENVLDEIEYLVRQYGIKEIHFDDDNIVLNKKRAQKLFQGIIDREIDIVWTVPPGLALWAVDDGLLELMKASGCYKLFIAVESGDEHMLREIIQKPLDLGKIKPLVKKMKDLDIELESFFVVGMPGETEESLQRSFRFARELDIDATHYFFANPMPGTRLWDISIEKGLLNDDFEFSDVRVERANLNLPELPVRRLEKLVAREQILGRTLTLIRHPFRMLKKYAKYFRKDPRVVFNFLFKNFRHSLRSNRK